MTKADDTLDVHMELHHHDKNFGRSITIEFGSRAKSHYTIQKSHKIAKNPQHSQKCFTHPCNDAFPLNALITPILCNPHLFLLTERIARAIQHISSLLDSFGGSVPVLLLNGVTDKRVDGRFEAVGGVGREDDVFELCAAGELVVMLVYVKWWEGGGWNVRRVFLDHLCLAANLTD
jgi:hypothetical protein